MRIYFQAEQGSRHAAFGLHWGVLLIKERYQFSDEETAAHITMNPYLQYFIGLKAYTTKSPFDASMLTRFRKRIPLKMLREANDIIIGRPKEKKDKNNDDSDDDGGTDSHEGTLILDATCAPQNIRFPTDASLLNEARLNAESIIDTLHREGLSDGRLKPRTYRKEAKNRYNSFSKSRKKSKKSVRKAIRQQLGYLKRDLKIIDEIAVAHPDYLDHLSKWEKDQLPVIRVLYAQQQEMFDTNTRRVYDRIVSLSQPWVRPIKRGKANKKTHNFLTEHDLLDLSRLDEAIDNCAEDFYEKRCVLKEMETRLDTLKDLCRELINYRKTRSVVDEGKKLSGRKAEAYRMAHEADYIIYEAARRRLKESYPGRKLPATKELNAEIETLISRKNAAYNDYRGAKAAFDELRNVRDNARKLYCDSRRQEKEQSHER